MRLLADTSRCQFIVAEERNFSVSLYTILERLVFIDAGQKILFIVFSGISTEFNYKFVIIETRKGGFDGCICASEFRGRRCDLLR
jgi:hypothetical protein